MVSTPTPVWASLCAHFVVFYYCAVITDMCRLDSIISLTAIFHLLVTSLIKFGSFWLQCHANCWLQCLVVISVFSLSWFSENVWIVNLQQFKRIQFLYQVFICRVRHWKCSLPVQEARSSRWQFFDTVWLKTPVSLWSMTLIQLRGSKAAVQPRHITPEPLDATINKSLGSLQIVG